MRPRALPLLSFDRCTDCEENKIKIDSLVEQDAKDPYSSVGLSSRCRGLWSECLYDHMAHIWTCDIPVSYLSDHPVLLVVTRTLVIVNGVLSISAAPLLVLGMKCTTIINKEDDLKMKLSRTAGIMLLLGGLCEGTVLLWYAMDTAFKYRAEVVLAVPGITYELGYSYWLAAVSAGCACVSAVLLICQKCKHDNSAEASGPGHYRPCNNTMTYL
ncbi:claudin-16-like [Hyperolius riggenbachi]|uniref:claudin-16-like n=1 Tax=Hyperolius riggenbachi TaxID=752182 RepID=UPI0035A296B1